MLTLTHWALLFILIVACIVFGGKYLLPLIALAPIVIYGGVTSTRYMHVSRTEGKIDVHPFTTVQMELLNDIYGKTFIASELNDYIHKHCGNNNTSVVPNNNIKLRQIVAKLILTNYNTIGEFYVCTDTSKDIFRADLAEVGLSAEYDSLMAIITRPIAPIEDEYLTATISVTDTAGALPFNATMPHLSASKPVEISYGDFTMFVPQYRIAMLRRYSDDIDIILTAMRYYCLLSDYQHNALSLDMYREYIKLGATIEGFASPFNSQIMRLENVYGQYRYCSIFDYDVVFNSLGNYFTTSTRDKFTILHPPAVDSILIAAAKKCIHERNESPATQFIFHGPVWEQSEYYKLLANYVALGKATMSILTVDQYNYENANGEPIKPTEPLAVFSALSVQSTSNV